MPNTNQTSAAMSHGARGFRLHAIIFAAVMTFLIAIDWYTAEPYWAHWVLIGWGLGLAAHAYLVYGRRGGRALRSQS